MCGARSYSAIAKWAQDQETALIHQLGLTRKPSEDSRHPQGSDRYGFETFEKALSRWAETLLTRPTPTAFSPLEAFALDGKSARGSFDGLMKAVHLLSLIAQESRLTLAQGAVPNGGDNMTNEHETALRLLEGMVLERRFVTDDAIFCQRDPSQHIVEAPGRYLWFVKEPTDTSPRH